MKGKSCISLVEIIFTVLLFKCFFVFVASISEKSLSELVKMTTPDKIREEGYESETHEVTTDDGYVIKMHRIPGKPGSTAVFLKHGFTSSSFDFVVTGKNQALAFILADNGYDVWLGNVRGNTYGRRHVKLEPSNPEFWNFTIHEMGVYDVPAMIKYITNFKNDSIIYVGHSLGTTLGFVMAIERPDIAAKIRIMIAMGPAVFLQHWTAPFKFFAKYIEFTTNFIKSSKMIYEFLPQNPAVSKNILKYLCYELTERNPCAQMLFFFDGYNPSKFNYTLVPLVFSHNPAGSSGKTFLHFLQMARVNKFQRYDYGPTGNRIEYNSPEPPQYDLSKLHVPVGIFWSESDTFINPVDLAKLVKAIPNKAVIYKVPVATFTHIDFLLSIDVPKLVYSKIVSVMDDYR